MFLSRQKINLMHRSRTFWAITPEQEFCLKSSCSHGVCDAKPRIIRTFILHCFYKEHMTKFSKKCQILYFFGYFFCSSLDKNEFSTKFGRHHLLPSIYSPLTSCKKMKKLKWVNSEKNSWLMDEPTSTVAIMGPSDKTSRSNKKKLLCSIGPLICHNHLCHPYCKNLIFVQCEFEIWSKNREVAKFFLLYAFLPWWNARMTCAK